MAAAVTTPTAAPCPDVEASAVKAALPERRQELAVVPESSAEWSVASGSLLEQLEKPSEGSGSAALRPQAAQIGHDTPQRSESLIETASEPSSPCPPLTGTVGAADVSHPVAEPSFHGVCRARAGDLRQSSEDRQAACHARLQGRVQTLSAIRAQRQARDQEADEAASCCYRSVHAPLPLEPGGRVQRLPRGPSHTAAYAAVGLPPPRQPKVESGLLDWMLSFFMRMKCCSNRGIEDN